MIKVKRIRHVTLTTPDVGRLVDYFQSIIGLGVAGRDANRVLMSSEAQQLAVVIERGAQPGCRKIGFEVAGDVDLAAVQRSLSDCGIKSEIQNDNLPGISEVLTIHDLEGGLIDVFSNCAPCPAQEPIGGLAVNKLGHVAMYTVDPEATSEFYTKIFGFRVSDWIEESFVFMRCGFDHHTLNFAQGEVRRLHHIAFEVRDASHLHQACDLLGRRQIEILWGPVRHGPGHNVAVYHRNPDGQLIELFFDMDRMVDEELGYFEPRPWHRDRPQRPKIWKGLPRDIWGLAPSPSLHEFRRGKP
ncbi:MAG: VOC family protein [Acidobacteriota bacterium]